MVGLAGTGKTTFLAALWHVVSRGDIPSGLRLKEFPNNREYLNKISSDWINCEPLGRTVPEFEKIVSMKLEDSESKDVVEVWFPDLSGETFRVQLRSRQWTAGYCELAKEAEGITLFIHPNIVVPPTRIDEVESIVREIRSQEEVAEDSKVEAQNLWDIDKMSIQAKLVELLQLHLNSPYCENIRRIAVVISAWDLVMNYTESPEKWLEKTLPFLDQFLKANKEHFCFRIYGVSAQGADLEKACLLLGKIKPEERIIIVGEECIPHDITVPVKWLMRG